ncbi:hypothetical protein [Cesiribacter sp. SM1]|uniref:hypothetical protein n=1 Tax=Cesiribacter sp. SM1 TaxID=2861196 RepID=UPI001CD6A375|nr:hypothetical protein [Cesiribacter sp. SM1]
MKRKYIIFLVFVMIQGGVYGQTSEISINDLQTPTSPGFVLSDQTPSSVSRPTNPRSLVASLLTLQRGGALELSPYWLLPIQKRSDLTFSKYINNKLPIIQTLSISTTSFRSDTTSYLSVGARLHLFRIYNKEAEILNDRIVSLLTPKLDQNNQPLPLDLNAIEMARDSLNELKPVFLVEIAGAMLGYSPTNNLDQLSNARNGVWANFLWRPFQSLNVIGLTRYINNNNQKEFSQSAEYFDVGGSLGFESNKNFTINGEFIFRNDLMTNINTHRLAIIANYKIFDQLYITGSYGKNFGKVDNIIAVLGVSFAFANEPLKIE